MFETDRGQATPVAIVLVFAIVIGGTVTVVAFGSTALTDIERSAENQRAEVTMTQFDASAARVALGESSGQTTSLPSGSDGAVNIDGTAGSIQIEVDCVGGGTDTLVPSTSLGSITYENARTTLAYQGGGVWKKNENGEARMVSPPEFHYRGATLTLPIILLRDGGVGSENVRISPVNIGNQQFPDPGGPMVCGSPPENPVASGTVTITINSEYAKGWGNYFETRTTGTASYPSTNTVVLELTSPASRPTLSSAVAASAGTGELRIEGTGGDASYTDSYDSSTGPYAGGTNSGDVVVRGDVELTGDSEVRGNLISGGNVDLGGSSRVDGDIEHYGTYSATGGTTVTGTVSSRSTRPDEIDELNPVVDSRVNDIQSDNDNGAENGISGTSLDAGDITIGEDSGSQAFYLENIDRPSGDTITIDTSNGDVSIGVRDYIRLSDSTIEVIGDGRVNFWVKGQSGVSASIPSGFSFSDAELVLAGGEIDVGSDDDSTQLFVYGKSDFGAAIKKDGSRATFDGVIYAPIGTSGSGKVGIRQSSVYGAIATGEINIENKANLHYDKALQDTDTIPPAANTVRVTFLHITTNEVEISDN